MGRGGARTPESRLGLRSRAAIASAFAALAVTVTLALVTFTLLRNYLTGQRYDVIDREAFVNARVVRDALTASNPDVGSLLASLREESGAFALLHWGGRWYGTTVGSGPDVLPAPFRQHVLSGGSGSQTFSIDGKPSHAVGVSIPSIGGVYVEVFPLDDLESTLRALRNSLIFGATIATAGGAILGAWTTRRVLRPLTRVAGATATLAEGDLETRLGPERDPDLDRLVRSFNDMADALQERIEREARFASDVSHELRTPLSALAAAADVLARRRDELPERSQQALDILLNQVRRFDRMTLDLLEISRLQAGAYDLDVEPVQVVDFLRRVAGASGVRDVEVVAGPGADDGYQLHTDKRRLERIVSNLIDNAQRHGDGLKRLTVHRNNASACIGVEDAGPGVPFADRARIFERFARGADSARRPGSGLGLALVAEQAHLLGGRAWVEDRIGGGARFVIELPDGAP